MSPLIRAGIPFGNFPRFTIASRDPAYPQTNSPLPQKRRFNKHTTVYLNVLTTKEYCLNNHNEGTVARHVDACSRTFLPSSPLTFSPEAASLLETRIERQKCTPLRIRCHLNAITSARCISWRNAIRKPFFLGNFLAFPDAYMAATSKLL